MSSSSLIVVRTYGIPIRILPDRRALRLVDIIVVWQRLEVLVSGRSPEHTEEPTHNPERGNA